MATLRVSYTIPEAFLKGYLESKGYRPTRHNVFRLRKELEAGAHALLDVNLASEEGDLWHGVDNLFPDLSENPDFDD